MSTTFHSLNITEVTKETTETVSISFQIPDNLLNDFQFKAGQYLTLRSMINGEDIRRSYSISSAPHEGTMTVAVKKVENGIFSTFAQNLSAGDSIEVMAPQGNFTIKTEAAKNFVFFAAGSGITPVISLIKTVLNDHNGSNVKLFYGNKSKHQTIYKADLDVLAENNENFDLYYLYSQENGLNDTLTGRINSQKIEDIYTTYLNTQIIDEVYSCGPESMIHAVNDFFKQRAISEANIHFELFTTPVKDVSEIKDPSNEPIPDINSSVTVVIDDEEFEFDLKSNGKNILQAAQDADADVPFSCKGGVCCTCRAKVMEGKAIMDLNYSLEPEEVEEGFILTCQAHPVTEKVVVSFDEY